MRVLCVIDNLNSGGAQRQMVMLAILLNRRGHDVRLFTYYPHDFYRPLLCEAGVPVECVQMKSKLGRILAVRKAIRSYQPDAVIAYLPTPCILAELASLPRRNYALIVSERNTGIRRLSFWLHRLADAVVSNSCSQEAIIRKVSPGLASRVTTIHNCVDLDKYQPMPPDVDDHKKSLNVLCVGRFEAQKNYPRLVEAVEIVHRSDPEIDLVIDVYGNNHFVDGKPGPLSGDFLKLEDALRKSPVKARFQLHDPVKDVAALYHQSDVLCLTSLWEGCPNVVCEAMACGKPILASRVGDSPVLVKDGVNGLLFDPTDPADIADAIVRFSRMSHEERSSMGTAGRKRAEELLSPDRFVRQYEELIESANRPGRLPRSGKRNV